jgi:hypothetical protein
MARKIDVEEGRMVTRVQEAVYAIMTTWHDLGNDFGYDTETREILSRHFEKLPLLRA